MRIRLTESDLERFWAKVEIRGEHECWPWQGSIHKSGYGHFRVGGKYGQIREAHALICEYFQGPFVGEVHVRHSCDNPVCCNPNHLIPGSRQENIDDMVAKGRNRSPRLGNGHPKLGPEDYREIADLYRGGENKSALARRFGVTPPRIRQILKEYGLSDMGMHTVASAIIGSQQKWERKPADFYPSPYNVTQVLLDFLNLPEGTSIWEPAAGEGDMAAVMEVNGHDVWSTDIRKTSFIAGGVNFLTAKQLISPEWIITNPLSRSQPSSSGTRSRSLRTSPCCSKVSSGMRRAASSCSKNSLLRMCAPSPGGRPSLRKSEARARSWT